ncbi:MAG TPA: phycobiliprotein lyase [Stenomitos sp.]
MDSTEFVDQSLEQWRSQHGVHHLAFAHFESVNVRCKVSLIKSNGG